MSAATENASRYCVISFASLRSVQALLGRALVVTQLCAKSLECESKQSSILGLVASVYPVRECEISFRRTKQPIHQQHGVREYYHDRDESLPGRFHRGTGRQAAEPRHLGRFVLQRHPAP